MTTEDHVRRFIHNKGLFANDYFDRVLRGEGVTHPRTLPSDWRDRLQRLRELWTKQRDIFIEEDWDQKVEREGLPSGWKPRETPSESDVENGFIRPVLDSVLGFHVIQNRTFSAEAAGTSNTATNRRPDLITFPSRETISATVAAFDSKNKSDGIAFCRGADMIIDAKAFSKGVGADEPAVAGQKKSATDRTAAQDVKQVADYLTYYQKKWGVLSNGRSWRLMKQGTDLDRHLRFDLVAFLEQLPDNPTHADRAVFELFWHLFGKPAVSGQWLNSVESEAEANTRAVRSVLSEQAHIAVEQIAIGFWEYANNGNKGLTTAPGMPEQREIDHLREVSLTLLYRLLFILKAEAQGLLRMRTPDGADTVYNKHLSTLAIFKQLDAMSASERKLANGWRTLHALFEAIDGGDVNYDIPAYNGGLFDPSRHPDLAKWQLQDKALHFVLSRLIYQLPEKAAVDADADATKYPVVPYGDLDVRDLGDIYEGLLEQRLIGELHPSPRLTLKNQKGERKASGTYFTPDSLVDYLVRRTLEPQLEAAGGDAEKILAIRVLDPAMGSGHFLVKAVDVMADWLTVNCDPDEENAPRDNGPAERAYWKRMVVEQCIYGVDYNPMAVELARVALWLHTAEFGKPLSFVDHHLKVGNSLVGISLDRLSAPALKVKAKRNGDLQWEVIPPPAKEDEGDVTQPLPPVKSTKSGRKSKAAPAGQLALPFTIDTSLVTGILQSIHAILQRPSATAAESKKKSQDYAFAVEKRLAAHRLLADLWCLQWFMGPPTAELQEAYTSSEGLYQRVKAACGIQDDARREAALAGLENDPIIAHLRTVRRAGYGPRRESFFHWQLEFPEVAFSDDGKARSGFGFDAVIGNPPWDRIRPERKQFYAPFGDNTPGSGRDIANTQAASLDRLIRALHGEHPTLEQEWFDYEQSLHELVFFLNESGVYSHQSMRIDGKRTGGDPDLFRYFVERAVHACRRGGRVGQIVPSTLWQAEGCSALRYLLFDATSCDELFVFENYRKWAFQIDSRFKFTAFVTTRTPPKKGHTIKSGFMLRDTRALEGKLEERLVRLDRQMIEAVSPGTLALLDYTSDADAKLIGRIHRDFPALGDETSGWDFTYRAELHMTNDAWRFKTREWMKERGFLRVIPEKQADGTWIQRREFGSTVAAYPDDLPPGGEYWVAADPAWYDKRRYRFLGDVEVNGELRRSYVHEDDDVLPVERGVPGEQRHLIVAGDIYRPIYVGRSIHLFDPAYQAYVDGAGFRQRWEYMRPACKLRSGLFFARERPEATHSRLAFRDIARATDERSIIVSPIPNDAAAGNKLPVLVTPNWDTVARGAAVLGSLVADFLCRQRLNTSVNWTFLKNLPVPRRSEESLSELGELARRLCSLTAEWQDARRDETAAFDYFTRAEIRARLDAGIAHAYGLSPAEFAQILATFPLLDRLEPALPGDLFLTETNLQSGENVIVTEWGNYESTSRSFVTRDLALLTYFELLGEKLPDDLNAFYRDEVGLDPEGPLSRFRIGEIRGLEERVYAARELGAIPYIPAGRGSSSNDEDGDEDGEQ